MNLGAKLKSLRDKRGLTVQELSNLSGVSASYITQIENGKKTEVTTKYIEKLAKALNTSPDFFRLEDTMLLKDLIPDLPEDIMEFLKREKSEHILRVSKNIIDSGISLEEHDALIEAYKNKIKKTSH